MVNDPATMPYSVRNRENGNEKQQAEVKKIYFEEIEQRVLTAAPDPAIVRPAIKVAEVGARPQIKEPNSKMASATRKTVLTLKTW
jgi:hypothetical protein